DPTALCLEIAENAVGEHLQRATGTLDRLRGLGVGIGIDDFGTGGTSHADLRRMPLDELKVDRSFVTNMFVDALDAAVVRLAIELGHRLGGRVVAEGVQDDRAKDPLAQLGCDLAQGVHRAPPMPAAGPAEPMRRGGAGILCTRAPPAFAGPP